MEWYQIAETVFKMEWTPDDEWRLFQTEQTECLISKSASKALRTVPAA